MTNQQPEALQLAELLEQGRHLILVERKNAGAELRRLHAENEALRKCSVKYLKWLQIKEPEAALEGDIKDPEMLA